MRRCRTVALEPFRAGVIEPGEVQGGEFVALVNGGLIEPDRFRDVGGAAVAVFQKNAEIAERRDMPLFRREAVIAAGEFIFPRPVEQIPERVLSAGAALFRSSCEPVPGRLRVGGNAFSVEPGITERDFGIGVSLFRRGPVRFDGFGFISGQHERAGFGPE